MSKIKDLIMSWEEMYDEGIPMEWTLDHFNWFDAITPPILSDGKWYREKESNITPTHQSDDPILPPDNIA